jgi:raffinose/stachyose/melibiose transport system substrate-binding protein
MNMTKSKKKLMSVILTTVLSLGLIGCGNTSSDKSTGATQGSEVKLKFFSNLPDRNSGQGKLEQTLIDNYMKENPNIKIEVEALQDEPYKQKFKAYAASNQIPDIYMVWGNPGFFKPIMEAGYAAELNKDDYKDYNFLQNSLDAFSNNGKLYGLPRNTDFMVLYYNKDIFEKNNVKVPTTIDELIQVSKDLRAKGITPCSTNGKDKWSLSLLYQDLVVKEGGNQQLIYDAINGKKKFAEDPILKKAADDFKALMDAGFFQDSFTSADYGAGQNMFAQEKAAMYYMGSWDVSMATNKDFSDSFKQHVDLVKFPVGKDGKATDIVGWNGGGYAVGANSQVKSEAIKLLNYIMKPDNWTKNGWEQGLVIPAQKYDMYLTGKENNLQTKLTEVIKSATSFSGFGWQDSLTPDFTNNSQDISQQFAAGILTPDKFLQEADNAVTKASNK